MKKEQEQEFLCMFTVDGHRTVIKERKEEEKEIKNLF
jgi:hypothetical protein